MSPSPWNPTPDFDDDDQTSPEPPTATLVSLHFVRTALRRRLLVCLLSAAAGLLAAGAFIFAFPSHTAQASLVLTHSSDADTTQTMATDVSLLKTRTVASMTTARLGLTAAPDEFLQSVKVEQLSSDLLAVRISAPTDAEAVRRLTALTSIYLEFRAKQLSLQSKIVVDGMQENIKKLQAEVKDLSRRIAELTAANSSSATTSTVSDMISQRAYLQDRIEALQQAVEDATLRNSAVVASSRVLDPPAAEPALAKRTVALGLMSGLIGGAALGSGTVLFFAITSDRLRRRADVAAALEVAVPVSVGRIAELRTGWRRLPPLHVLNRHRADERQRMAHAIEQELPQGRGRLAVAGIDNADEVAFAVAAAAERLAARDRSITIIDLSEHPNRGLRFAPSTAGSSDPTVLRPRGLPALAHGAADLLAVGQWDTGENTPLPQLTDGTLVLADLDPAVGADYLTAWADRVILVVTAGRTSVEKVRTVGDQVRAAGLDLRFAILMHTERTDDSSGTASVERPAGGEDAAQGVGTQGTDGGHQQRDQVALQLRDEHERVESTEKSEVR
jgi:uncharacterized protein involved in exopolysaccharide biosynthesis